jgi:hypothetical protein
MTGENTPEIYYDSDVAVRNLIRTTMNREYGPVQAGAYSNGSVDRSRAQMIDFIMNLRMLSVAALGRVHITDADIVKVCACIKRLELVGYRNLPFIFEYCARRAVRDPLESHQRDPLQFRHMLTFSIDVPNFDMPQEELSLIECHLAEGNAAGITDWFQRHGESSVVHNKGLTAYLRRYLLDYTEVPAAALKAYAFELAVLDVRLSGPVGWENSRSFLATLCVVQNRRHDHLEVYMDDQDISSGLLAHQHCGDADGRTYYSLRLDRFDPSDLKALEQSVFDAASRKRRDNDGPGNGRRKVVEKRSWWRSLLGQAELPAQGFVGRASAAL